MKRLLAILMILIMTVLMLPVPTYATDDYDPYSEENEMTFELHEDDENNISNEFNPAGTMFNNIPGVNVDDPLENNHSGGISTFALEDPDEETDITFELDGLTEAQLDGELNGSYFHNIVYLNENEKNRSYLYGLVEDEFDYYPYKASSNRPYLNMQGSCNDGEYVYYAFFVGDKYKKNPTDEEDTKDPVGSCIIAGKFNESGTFVTEKITFSTDLVSSSSGYLSSANDLMHVNDIAYNSLRDELVVVCCQTGYHNQIYRFDAAYFRGDTQTVPKAELIKVSCRVSSLTYNEKKNVYLGGVTGDNDQFVIFDSDFNIIDSLDNDYNHKGVARHGICSDDNFIYTVNYISEYSEVKIGDPVKTVGSVIGIFDWSGNLLKEIYLDIDRVYMKNSDGKEIWGYYEIEGITIMDDKILLGFNCMYNSGNGYRYAHFYQCDISDYFFNVKYCPNDNVSEHINSTDLKSNNVLHGFSTKTLENTYRNSDNKFIGWHLYAVASNKWRYYNSSTKTYKWCVEDSEPSGYIKAVYPEHSNVSNTVGAGNQVLFCAAWGNADNEFLVYYRSNPNNMSIESNEEPQLVTSGVSTPLEENTFTKEGRTFKGWNAYCVEWEKWYYEDLDTGEKGWYREGEEPEGNIKYRYSGSATVKKTVPVGCRVIFVAQWNEFVIYYDANGRVIQNNAIKEPTIAVHGSNNTITKYSARSLSADDAISNPSTTTFGGFYQYRIEKELWRYAYSGNSDPFWATNSSESLYYYTGNSVTQTASIGEHVKFIAKWN